MVYRNGWREFFILAIGFGAPMGVFFIIQYGFAAGAIGGLCAGLLFGGIMTLFTRGTEKKFAGIRAEISADRPIICEGGYTL
jgi:amino acid transporter